MLETVEPVLRRPQKQGDHRARPARLDDVTVANIVGVGRVHAVHGLWDQKPIADVRRRVTHDHISLAQPASSPTPGQIPEPTPPSLGHRPLDADEFGRVSTGCDPGDDRVFSVLLDISPQGAP